MHRIRRRTLHAYAAYALLCYVYYPVTEMILIDNSGETIANFSDDGIIASQPKLQQFEKLKLNYIESERQTC